MRIGRTINMVPGGLMVVPLAIGMVINTFFPTLLKIGCFIEALSSVGYPTILGTDLFTVGTKMTVRTAPRMLERGFGIMAAKVGVATLIAVSVGKFFGGNLFGFSTFALLAAMSDTNDGMFKALTSVMGDKEETGTYVPQSIEAGPFLTMVILVAWGSRTFPGSPRRSPPARYLGNLDTDLRGFFGSHEPIIVPFMAFTLGQTINLSAVVTAGIPGAVLGLMVVIIAGAVCILTDRPLGGSGIAGAAASSFGRRDWRRLRGASLEPTTRRIGAGGRDGVATAVRG